MNEADPYSLSSADRCAYWIEASLREYECVHAIATTSPANISRFPTSFILCGLHYSVTRIGLQIELARDNSVSGARGECN